MTIKLLTLHHASDPKSKVTVNEDHAQAYLQSGWAEKPAKDEDK